MDVLEWVRNAANFCSPGQIAPLAAGAPAKWGVTATLKPHQEEGVAWLIERYNRGVNVILADEMGLGKTVQTITLLAYLSSQKRIPGPFLVISPLSVTEGWASELRRFAPKLRTVRYASDREQREAIRKEITDGVNKLPADKRADPPLEFDVLLTTYELAMLDVAFLGRFRWRMCVVDEAQRLKNDESVLYKTLTERYLLPRRLLLTGTPVQNNLAELGALLRFCMPKIFPDARRFADAFAPAAGRHNGPGVNTPDSSANALGNEAETRENGAESSGNVTGGGVNALQRGVKAGRHAALAVLRAALHSFMLRRTKAALVAAGALALPSLAEVALFAPMVPVQRRVYLSVLKKELPRFGGDPPQAGALQNIVVQLRKACSHPYLFGGVEPEPFQEGEHLVEASGKLMLLDLLLSKLKAAGHCVLIFAQMARTLDILQDYLEMRRYGYERLDGSVRAEERFEAVKSFSGRGTAGSSGGATPGNGDADPFIFLLTTRAGGVGLNLVAADTVIFFELDWNPQADLQAMQRAHRIGQRRPVLAVRLVTQHSVEEVILRRSKRKLRLTRDVIGRDDDEVEARAGVASGAAELREMIQFGLHRLGADGSDDVSALRGALAGLVATALAQRDGRAARASSQLERAEIGTEEENGVEEDDENIYSYEGKDYSGKKGGEKSEDDERALQEIANESAGAGTSARAPGAKRRPRSAEDEAAAEEARARKRQKAEERKHARWKEVGYETLALDEPEPSDLEDRGPGEDDDVTFVIGDVTQPKRGAPGEPAIIVSCCDNSGTWGRGGMFRALEALSTLVSQAYEAAGEAGDLHPGDLHLIPVEVSGNQIGPSTSGGQSGGPTYVALAIAQEYDRRKKTPRSDLQTDAFQAALDKLAAAAVKLKASVHLPRLTVSAGGGRADWYAIERLLRKCLTSRGLATTVYYHRRT